MRNRRRVGGSRYRQRVDERNFLPLVHTVDKKKVSDKLFFSPEGSSFSFFLSRSPHCMARESRHMLKRRNIRSKIFLFGSFGEKKPGTRGEMETAYFLYYLLSLLSTLLNKLVPGQKKECFSLEWWRICCNVLILPLLHSHNQYAFIKVEMLMK